MQSMHCHSDRGVSRSNRPGFQSVPRVSLGMSTGRRILAVSAVLAAVVVLAASPAGATTSGRDGRIAYKHFFDVGFARAAIFTANPDGSEVRQVTHPAANTVDDFPQWSPGGSRLVFTRFSPGADRCYTVLANGMDQTHVAGTAVFSVDPPSGIGCEFASFAPDGKHLALSLASGGLVEQPTEHIARLGIYVSDAKGNHLRQLTQFGQTTTSEDHEPAWSPDGQRIVFTRINTVAAPVNQQALFIMDANGGNIRRITPWSLNAGGADWSPDGSEIAFQSYRDCACTVTSQIFIVHTDGTDLDQITTNGRNIEPSFSPSGNDLVFGHNPGTGSNGFADIDTLNIDETASHLLKIIHTPMWESEPAWGTAPLLDQSSS